MRPSHKTFLFIILSLISFATQANCPLSEEAKDLECKGTFKAQSIADIEAYKTDYKLKNGKARNLKIDFNVDTTELNIASPCNIIVAKERNVTTSGNICLTAKKKIIFKAGGSINAADMTLTSVGSDEFSRVHIRNTKTVTANNLTLKAYSRATLGHTSNYFISGDVKLETTGEGRFSSIWKNTTVNANSITLISADSTRLSRGVVLNAPVVNLDGIECNVNKSVVINSDNIIGNCLSGAHPNAVVKVDTKSGNIPLTVNFNFSESNDDGGIVKYVFDPADGSPVVELTTTSYTHTYTVAGTYKAKLVVYDEGGLKDTRKKRIRALDSSANQAPTANFTMSKSTAMVGESVTFDASASTDDKGIVNYIWDFTDTASKEVSEAVTSYTFMEPGTYTVELSVLDEEGLVGDASKTITITEDNSDDSAPTAYFKFEREANTNDTGEEETFLLLEFFGNAGSTPLVSAEYEIIQTGQKITPRDLYISTKTEVEGLPFGIYDVKLTVTDQAGKTDSFTHNVVLNGDDQDPILDFDVEQSGVNTAFLSLLNSFDPVDFAFEFDIDWGDGSSDSLSDDLGASHTYAQAGTYNVTVTFNSPEVGTSTTLSKSVTVSTENTEPLEPVANYVRWQEDFAGHVRFYEELSLSPNGEIVSFHWNFGDGSEGYGEEVAHFYEPGVYLVTLTVTDSMGMRDTQVQRIVITEPGPPTLVGGECWAEQQVATCFAIALDDFEELTEVSIDWGDGTIEIVEADQNKWFEIEKEHNYAANGTFNVKMTASTSRGETVEFLTEVSTFTDAVGYPTAEFSCNMNGLSVECFDFSSDSDGFITNATFNMGDGTTYTNIGGYLQHTYQSEGVYNISLTVEDNDLNSSSSFQEVYIFEKQNEKPILALSCSSEEVLKLSCNFSAYDNDGFLTKKTIKLNQDTEIELELSQTEYLFNFSEEGENTVVFTAFDNDNESSSISKTFTVNGNSSPIAIIDTDKNSGKVPLTVSFSGTSSSDPDGHSLSYEWSINGETFNSEGLSYVFNDINTYNVTLKVTDELGASSSTQVTISAIDNNSPPVAEFECDVASDLVSCNNLSTDVDGNISLIKWFIDNVELSTGSTLSSNVSGKSSFQVKIIVEDAKGLSSEKSYSFSNVPETNVSDLEELSDSIQVPITADSIAPSTVNEYLDQSFTEKFNFLFTGENPIQQGVVETKIVNTGTSLIRGKIVDLQNNPVSKVLIEVIGRDYLGRTYSREDGSFDLFSDKGTSLSLRLTKADYVTEVVRREIRLNEINPIENIVLSKRSATAHVVSINESSDQLVTNNEESGLSLVFSRTNKMYLINNGIKSEFSGGNLRLNTSINEENEIKIDFNFDEKEIMNAESISFEEPVPVIFDNVLNYPAGTSILQEYINPQTGIREESFGYATVHSIIGEIDGLPQIDINGDGLAETYDVLRDLDFSEKELDYINQKYSVGSTFFRSRVLHFSSYVYGKVRKSGDLYRFYSKNPNLNINYYSKRPSLIYNGMTLYFTKSLQTINSGPPAPPPINKNILVNMDKNLSENISSPRNECGSIIDVDNLSLGEIIGDELMSFSLFHSTKNTLHYNRNKPLRVDLSGELADDVIKVEVNTTIEGRTFKKEYSPSNNIIHEITWDGLDAFGRVAPSSVKAYVEVKHFYPQGKYSKNYTRAIVGKDLVRNREFGSKDVGGWSVSNNHKFDFRTGAIYFGDGSIKSPRNVEKSGVKDLYPIASNNTAKIPIYHFPVPNDNSRFNTIDQVFNSLSENNAVRKIISDGTMYTLFHMNDGYHRLKESFLSEDGSKYYGRYNLESPLQRGGTHSIILKTELSGRTTLYTVNRAAAMIMENDYGISLDSLKNGGVIIHDVEYFKDDFVVYDYTDSQARYPVNYGQSDSIVDFDILDNGDLYVIGTSANITKYSNSSRKFVIPRFYDQVEHAYSGFEKNILFQTFLPNNYNDSDAFQTNLKLKVQNNGELLITNGTSVVLLKDGSDERDLVEFESSLDSDSVPHGSLTEGTFLNRDSSFYTRHCENCGPNLSNEIIYSNKILGDGNKRIILRRKVLETSNIEIDGNVINLHDNNDPHSRYSFQEFDRFKIISENLRINVTSSISGRATSYSYLLKEDELHEVDRNDGSNPDHILASFVSKGEKLFALRYRRNEGQYPYFSELLKKEIVDDLIYISDTQRGEKYIFDNEGKHLETKDLTFNTTKVRFEYDGEGRVVKVIDRLNRETLLERDSEGKVFAITTPDGSVRVLTYNGSSMLESFTGPLNNSYELEYDANNFLTKFTKPKGNFSSFTYDDIYLRRDENSLGGYKEFTLTENSLGKEIVMTNENNALKKFITRHPASNKLEQETLNFDGTTSLTSLSNDIRSIDNTDLTKTIVNESDYSAPGQKLPKINDYDVEISSTKSLTVKNEYLYSEDSFNTQGDLVKFSLKTSYNSKSTLRDFDILNYKITDNSPLGYSREFIYNQFGNVLTETDGSFTPVSYSYDSSQNLTSVSQGVDRVVNLTWDSKNFLESVDNGTSSVTYERDLLGRATKIINADGSFTSFSYDLNGNISSITPHNRGEYSFINNELDSVGDFVAPELTGVNNTTSYSYTPSNLLTRVNRPSGDVINFNYDFSKNRLSSITANGVQRDFTYDSTTGKLNGKTNAGNNLSYVYDGKLLTDINVSGVTAGNLNFGYDDDLNLFRLQLSDVSNAVYYTYDDDNRIDAVSDLDFIYDNANNKLTDKVIFNLKNTLGYNQYGELDINDYKFTDNSFYKESITRDNLGRVSSIVETINGESNIIEYAYDSLGQLENVKINGSFTEQYVYGDNGNRFSSNGIPYIVDGQDRLTSFDDYIFEYNDNGDTIKSIKGIEETSFSYNGLGELTNVVLANGDQIQYHLDGNGRRIAKSKNSSVVEKLVYLDQLNPLARLNSDNSINQFYVYGSRSHVPDYIISGSDKYMVVTNHLGSVRFVVNVITGDIVQEIEYDSFGKVIKDTNPNFQPFGFAGGLVDNDTGLVRFGARDYNPVTGRWMQKDPIGFQGKDTNLYRYCVNSPLNCIDPDGLNARFLFQFGHILIEVDDPNNKSGVTTIDLGPAKGESFVDNVIAGFTGGSIKGEVRITRGKAPFAFPVGYRTLTPDQDARLVQRARELQKSFKKGDLRFNPFGFSTDGDSTNCIGFSVDLVESAK